MKADPLRHGLPASATRSFVDAIAQRHRVARAAQRMQRMLRVAPPASVVANIRHVLCLRFSPDVRVAIATELGRVRRVLGESVPQARRIDALAAPAMRTLRHEVLTSRLLERESRVSSLDVRASSRVLRSVEEVNRVRRQRDETPARNGAAGRVFAHPVSAAAAAAKVAAALRPAESRAQRFGADTVLPPVTRAIDAAVDVNLLTRDVMRAIDERIVAHRERQGWSSP